MDPTEIQDHAQRCLNAAVLNDRETAAREFADFMRVADPRDALLWTVGMIQVSSHGMPRIPGALVMPQVGQLMPDGSVRVVPIDEAPLGARAYARLLAAYLSDDRQQVRDVWVGLVASEDDPEGDQIAYCMRLACMAAATTVRRHRASNQ